MNERYKCEEIKNMLGIAIKYLKSLQDCMLQGEPILEKDHNDINELIEKAEKLVNNK